ncbi:MAG: peptide chain release factor 2 [bacterium]
MSGPKLYLVEPGLNAGPFVILNELCRYLIESNTKLSACSSPNCRTIFDLDKLKAENEELATEMSSPDFWKDQKAAAAKGAKFDLNQKIIQAEQDLGEALARVGEAMNDDESTWADKDVPQGLAKAGEIAKWLESQTLFNGPYDDKDVYLFFHVGTGGIDAADWNEMLLGMYLKYAEQKGWQTEILQRTDNEEAGMKNATVRIRGHRAYGWLKTEAGVHRLIRLSPFNAQNLRQTSFALIEVLPDLGEVDVEIKEDDLRIETFKSSGHGGQSVNTTDSAVRIVHVPTGLSASCQNERSQLQNKAEAMRILKNKLYIQQHALRAEAERGLKAATASADFGHQIRSYTLHPYQQIKDHRSNFESSQVDKVIKNGELDDVIISVLMGWRTEPPRP